MLHCLQLTELTARRETRECSSYVMRRSIVHVHMMEWRNVDKDPLIGLSHISKYMKTGREVLGGQHSGSSTMRMHSAGTQQHEVIAIR